MKMRMKWPTSQFMPGSAPAQGAGMGHLWAGRKEGSGNAKKGLRSLVQNMAKDILCCQTTAEIPSLSKMRRS